MPGFRFRLKTSLHLAEQKLDDRKIQLAQETAKLQERIFTREKQKEDWLAALDSQRKAGLSSPEDLGMWQVFTSGQLRLLRKCEQELILQEELVARKRSELMEARRDCEKLLRLREKQAIAFQLEANRREQAVIDEVAQVQYVKQIHNS
ncbi:MAG TPA: flagellar FliJ family protein [Desulfitobacteriaceae bacterium]|jgi:flagellar export protein FliJ|nr:flagellar FliJ family protein [Desulfitobacteriaceae bacterium]